MRVTVRVSRISDVLFIGENLRLSDKIEIRDSTGLSPQVGLEKSFSASLECYTILHDNIPTVMFGIAPGRDHGTKKACVWMLATDGIYTIKKSFNAIALKYIKRFLKKYKVLFNYIDPRNAKTTKWLRRCGAIFYNSYIIGPTGLEFQYFEFAKRKDK